MEEKSLLFVKTAEKIAKQVKANQDLIGDDSALQFINRAEKEATVFARKKEEGRNLVIGIVGCVKAGKSTFLNALIFDGRQVLPKAATPMTAALTRIRYSDKPDAKIVFYRSSDWTNIRSKDDQYNRYVEAEFQRRYAEFQRRYNQYIALNNVSGNFECGTSRSFQKDAFSGAVFTPPTREKVEEELCASGDISDDLRSSHELVKMVEKRNLNVEKYLGKEEHIELHSGRDYQEGLRKYIGADGQFTPIVNYIELSINDPGLKGVVIVDTPGLNDPIVSRERKTIEFLTDCDVVFVVSSVSQFLVESDIQLLQKKLNQNNIHRAYIIGTQLDSGVLQYKPRKKVPLVEALCCSEEQYKTQARDVIGKLNTPSAPVIIQRLVDHEPIFVSAMMYSIGQKLRSHTSLNEDERFILGNLNKRFPDFNSVMESSDDYLEFSNIQAVKDKVLSPVRDEKEATIREGIEQYTVNQSAELLRLLEIVNTSVRTRLSTLENADAEVLERKLSHLSDKLDSIRGEISGLFQRQAAECNRVIQNTKVEISKEISHHQDLQVESKTEHRSRTEKTGLLGLRKTLIEWDEHTQEVSTSQVISNLRQYAADAQRMINENLQKLFDVDGLKQRIKECVIGAFDLASKEFNENEILLPLEVMLAGLSVQEVNFDFLEKIETEVDSAFPDGLAKGEDIHKLYDLQNKLANWVLRELSGQLDLQNVSIKKTMDLQSGTFVDTIEKKIAGNIETLKAQLKSKKENIAKYQKFITDIINYKQELLSFQR